MKFSTRIIGTVLLLVGYLSANALWAPFKASIEAGAAIQQTKNSVISYVFAEQMARGNLVANILFGLFTILLVLIWAKPIVQALRGNKNGGTTAALGLIVFVGMFFNTGCGPAQVQPLETVGPNETAFVIPMEGDSSNQAKFESVDFLREHKVLSKRITIPIRQRDTGRCRGTTSGFLPSALSK